MVCDPHCDLFDVNELRPSQNYLILFLVNLNESVSHVRNERESSYGTLKTDSAVLEF